MSFLKLNGGAGAVLVALAMLAATCQPALADTTTLVCSTGSPVEASPTTIDLDETKGLVTVHNGSTKNPGGSPDPALGGTQGPLTAKFDQNTITFETPGGDGYASGIYTINRLTGIVAIDMTPQGHHEHFEWTCHVGKKQF